MSDDLLATDPNWTAVARFLEGRIRRGQRVTAPPAFARVTGPLAVPDPTVVPDWAVVHKGRLDDYPAAILRGIAAEATPVFANDVFVVFSRRPTFGLRNQRGSVHVAALLERIGALPAEAAPIAVTPPSPPPPPIPVIPTHAPAPLTPEGSSRRPSLPPEALALLRRPSIAAPERAETGLRGRITALLAGAPAARVAEIGITGLAEALGATEADTAEADTVILRAADPTELDSGLEAARCALSPGGRILLVADNAESLGRRLARAAGRDATGGICLPDLLGALRAAGFRPGRAHGFSLDPWRVSGAAPPPDQAPGTPGGDILDAVGADAGPHHAALLLVLARPA